MTAYTIGAGETYETMVDAEAVFDGVSGTHTVEIVADVTETAQVAFSGSHSYTSVRVFTDPTNKHDGSPGSATYVWNMSSSSPAIAFQNDDVEIEDCEIDGQSSSSRYFLQVSGGATGTMRRCLVHNRAWSGTAEMNAWQSSGGSTQEYLYSNIFADIVGSGSGGVKVINADAAGTSEIIGNTIAGCGSTHGSAAVSGLSCKDASSKTLKNNLVADLSGNGTITNYVQGSPANTTTGGNASDDATSPDAAGDNASPSFVAAGSNNYKLAAALGIASDLGAVGEDGAIDILDRNRDTEGDTWDAGAHQYVAAGGGATNPKGPLGRPLHGPLAGPVYA